MALSSARNRDRRSVPPRREQAPRDHLGLDLGGALEDVEDAGVAEHAADLVLLGIAIAAVDLQRVVGVGKGPLDPKNLGLYD